MADWWGNGGNRSVMPLSNDWWGTGAASAGGGASAPAPARSLNFKQPGAGLENAGIDARDMFPRFEKLRGLKDQKEGGNAQLWKNLSRWTSTPNAQHLAPDQAAAFNHYVQTGERLPTLKDETVATALDWGVREGTRSQVHKKTFMQSTLGKLLGIPITAAGYAVGGPLGAGIANGLYQGIGNHDVLSGLGGFASGYAGGSFGGKLLGVTGNAAGLPGGGTVSGLFGGGAPLSNINQFMPSDIISRAGTGAAGPEKLITKGASGVAKALRNRNRNRDRKWQEPPSLQVGMIP